MKPQVIILMGSPADMDHSNKIAEAARVFALDVEVRVGSAHRTPEHVLGLIREYEANGRPKVYITVAGRSNALSGFTDPQVTAPVIACPPPSDDAQSVNDIWSSVRMAPGVACAYVAEPVNAAAIAASGADGRAVDQGAGRKDQVAGDGRPETPDAGADGAE